MASKLRIGIVGADANGQGWGPLAHFPALRSLPEFEIAALCTSRPETARLAAERYGVPRAYHDVREMAASPDIDIVTVVVRAPNHHDVAMAALASGKPMYCEWPLAANTAQAEAIHALASKVGVPTAIGLQARVDPTLRYVRDLVDQRFIGDVLAVTMAMLSPGVPERPKSKIWEASARGGVSALTIRGMHSMDALCMCVGELRELNALVTTQVEQWRVSETGDNVAVDAPDSVILGGTLQSGAVVSSHIATMPCATPGFRMEIHGSSGALHVSTPGAVQRDANRLMHAKGRGRFEPLEVPSRYIEVPAETPQGPPHNVAHLYRRFAAAIRSNATFAPDFAHGLKRHQLIDAIMRASDERRTVKAPS